MTRRETHITNVIRSRGVAMLLMILGSWMVLATPGFDLLGLADPASLVMTLLTGAAMIMANRQFNLMRTTSLFFAGLFMVSCGATPTLFTSGIMPALLALTVMTAMWVMFSVYNERRSDRRIFLVFTLLSAGSLLSPVFLFYIPVFLIGLGQMRIFRFKKLLAALIGIATPWWIALGLGVVPLPRLPHIFFTPPSMILDNPGGWPFMATVALTLVVGFLTGSVNLIRILGFNSRARAVNGLLSLTGIATGVFAMVNFTNLSTYVVLLNVCAAFQTGHFFRATVNRRGYIFVLSLLASYAGLYIWSRLS